MPCGLKWAPLTINALSQPIAVLQLRQQPPNHLGVVGSLWDVTNNLDGMHIREAQETTPQYLELKVF